MTLLAIIVGLNIALSAVAIIVICYFCLTKKVTKDNRDGSSG